MVIFGASGDLTSRKLLPALFSLFQRDLLPEPIAIIGCSRKPLDDHSFREMARLAIKARFAGDLPRKLVDVFLASLHYVSGEYDDPDTYRRLGEKLTDLERPMPEADRLFYLSVPATLYERIGARLHEAGLSAEDFDGKPARRVVLEKPFGFDLDSSRSLDRELRSGLHERQIFRIDHYLGKETVQNLLMFRFANAVFEPVWNHHYIDHVQITVAESIGVEHRAGYFDQAGLLRDMFQNHMFQMLAVVGMEPPSSFEANRVRDEKAKLLDAIRPFPAGEIGNWVVRGQYGPGIVDGQPVPGYRAEEGVRPDSPIETFVAARLMVDNWRWRGVPFYLRVGKRLPRRTSRIVITFKPVPHSIFHSLVDDQLPPNVLVFNVQPEEGVALHIQAKRPGSKLCMGNLTMHFTYREVFGGEPPEAYERLLLDAMLGDHTLILRNDSIDLAWKLLTPVLDAWAANDPGAGELETYPAGSWGSGGADCLAALDGHAWHRLD
jgi:glucose-6-phosphate 1-dehydrogenase